MIAAKVLGYYWIDGKKNPADIVSKHWSYPQVWHLLKPILFYSGNTGDLVQRSDIEFNPDLNQAKGKVQEKLTSTTTSPSTASHEEQQ